MFSRQKTTQVCDIPKRTRPAPIRVCPWEKPAKGEPEEKKFSKKAALRGMRCWIFSKITSRVITPEGEAFLASITLFTNNK